MVKQCAMCKKLSYLNRHLSYHRFPKDENLRKQWLDSLGFDENKIIRGTAVICSQHFATADIKFKPSGVRCVNKGSLPLPYIPENVNHEGDSSDSTVGEETDSVSEDNETTVGMGATNTSQLSFEASGDAESGPGVAINSHIMGPYYGPNNAYRKIEVSSAPMMVVETEAQSSSIPHVYVRSESEIYLKAEKMKACCTCLQILSEGTFMIKTCDFFSTEIPDKDPITLKDQLSDCVPEFLLGSNLNTFLCKQCAVAITGAYKLKQKCLETRTKVQSYINSMPLYTQINIEDVALHYRQLEIGSTGGDPIAMHTGNNDATNRIMAVKEELLLSSPSSNEGSDAAKAKAISTVYIKQEPPSDDEGEDEEVLNCTYVTEDMIALAEPELNTREVYKCMLCNNLISSYSKFCYHMLLHNDKNRIIKCSECEFSSMINKEIVEHLMVHNISCNEECHLCKARFRDKTALIFHMSFHANLGVLYKCTFCSFCFDDCFACNLHVESHDDNRKLTCQMCLSRFQSKRKLKHHLWFQGKDQKCLKRQQKNAQQSNVPSKFPRVSRSQTYRKFV